MGFSRQEYWSGWPCPPPWDLPNPGIELPSLMSAALVGRFFTRIMTVYFWISVLTILNLFFSPLHPYSHPHLHRYMEACGILYRGQYEEIQAESISQYFKNVIYTTHHYTSPSKMIQWKDDFDESFCFTHCISITFCLSSHRTNFTIFRTRFFFLWDWAKYLSCRRDTGIGIYAHGKFLSLWEEVILTIEKKSREKRDLSRSRKSLVMIFKSQSLNI